VTNEPPIDRGDSEFEELIGKSSFGTPGARALSDRTEPDIVRSILDRTMSDDLDRTMIDGYSSIVDTTSEAPRRRMPPAPGRPVVAKTKIRVTIVQDEQTFPGSVAALLDEASGVERRATLTTMTSSHLDREPADGVVLLDARVLHSPDLSEVSRMARRGHRVLIMSEAIPTRLMLAAIAAGALGFLNTNADQDTLLRAIGVVAQGQPYLSHEMAKTILDNRMLSLLPQDEHDLHQLASVRTYARRTVATRSVRLAQGIFGQLRTVAEAADPAPMRTFARTHHSDSGTVATLSGDDEVESRPHPPEPDHTPPRDHVPPRADLPSAAALAAAGELLRVLTAPVRIAILLQLREGEQSVHDLVDALDVAQPLLSQHLRVLKGADVVRGERRGREVVYRLADDQLADIVLGALTHVQRGQ
jgi:ArsR family transcriptional regulator